MGEFEGGARASKNNGSLTVKCSKLVQFSSRIQEPSFGTRSGNPERK
jgi:hypothetical protein